MVSRLKNVLNRRVNQSDQQNKVIISSPSESLTKAEWNSYFKKMNPFAKYLPYIAYDQETQAYYLRDNYVGFIYECTPLLFASSDIFSNFKSLLKLTLPKRTIIQFILLAHPWIEDFVAYYLESKKYISEDKFIFYKKYAESLTKDSWYGFPPARDFTFFVCIKFPSKEVDKVFLKDTSKGIFEILRTSYLLPRMVSPERLLYYLRKLFGQNYNLFAEDVYNPAVEISRQIILADSPVEVDGENNVIKTGDLYWKILTPRTLPPEINWDFMSQVVGSYDGPAGDMRQVSTPFLISLNIIADDLNNEILAKSNVFLYQQSFGSFAVSLKKKTAEYLEAVSSINEGNKYYNFLITVAVFGKDLKVVEEASKQCKQLWVLQGCQMQEESILKVPLFIMSLPFGFYYDPQTIKLLFRNFVAPDETLSAFVPVQSDFKGTGEPALLFRGRKGQIVTMDIFSKRSSSYNFFIAAPTGKGKSFLMNYLIFNYYGMGARIGIVDVGRSYKKLATVLGGDFIEFTKDSDFSLNPFAYVREEEDISLVTQVLLSMITSSTERIDFASKLPESAVNILASAIRWSINQAQSEGRLATTDDVYFYLSSFPEYFDDKDLLCEDHNRECLMEFKNIATHLAFNLKKFTSSGQYWKWFRGENILDLSNSKFFVLELEELKAIPDLFNVVSLLVLNLATYNLYLSDRSTPTLIVVDEAWQFLDGKSEAIQKIIEEGYRRARKYYGSFSIITQSILDLEHFGPIGKVIYSNSAFRFLLESGDFYAAIQKGILPFEKDDKFMINLLKSVKFNAPKYSEIFVLTDNLGYGVVRLSVDKYTYYLFTTNPKDLVRIEKYVNEGYSYVEAIEKVIEEDEKGA